MDLQENLEKLHFSKLETRIYLALLGAEPLSAYQLAKKIEIARPSIYNALEHMLEKGMVMMAPGSTALYTAQEPEVLFGKLQLETEEAISQAKRQLADYRGLRRNTVNLIFKGFETVLFQAKSILQNAGGEVYVNTDFDLTCFGEEFRALKERGVRVVVFSFYELETGGDVEFYSHRRRQREDHKASRLMLAADGEIALTADSGRSLQEWTGMLSNNILFVRMLSEHIHNDIYLLKLKGRYGAGIYGESLYLHTAFEERQRREEA